MRTGVCHFVSSVKKKLYVFVDVNLSWIHVNSVNITHNLYRNLDLNRVVSWKIKILYIRYLVMGDAENGLSSYKYCLNG